MKRPPSSYSLKRRKQPKRKRLRVAETIPVVGTAGNVYEVVVLENGKVRCPCKGFRYRSECRHLLDPEVRDASSSRGPTKRPYGEVAALATWLAGAILPCCRKVKIMGSLRRQRPMVKDIDIVFVPGVASTQQVVNLFRTFGRPVHHGDSMGAIVTPAGIAAQLWPVEAEEVWGAAQLHFTGPRDYNISLRIRANRRGWKLSQHGLVERASERLIAGKTEEEVLAALDLPWLPPTLRDDHRRAKVLRVGRRTRLRPPGKGF
ncbi:MAG: hypothetical protein JKY65_30130 [Planctomycetes bacterium]|nr:hypothetical protein [Planctomycetota bacterium]